MTSASRNISSPLRRSLVNAREHAEISQSELARRLSVRPSHISNIERGASNPSAIMVEQWLQECGATFRVVVGGHTRRDISDLDHEQRKLLNKFVAVLLRGDPIAVMALAAHVSALHQVIPTDELDGDAGEMSRNVTAL